MTVELEQTVAAAVPRSEHDDLVAAVERFMRLEGTTVETAGGLVWTCGGKLGQTVVELISWRGGTKIQLVGRYWDMFAWVLVAAALIGWMPGLVVVAGLELGPGVGAAVFAAGYLLTLLGVRILWHGIGREQERGLRALLQRIIEHAQMSEEPIHPQESDVTGRRPIRDQAFDPARGTVSNPVVGADGPSPHRR